MCCRTPDLKALTEYSASCVSGRAATGGFDGMPQLRHDRNELDQHCWVAGHGAHILNKHGGHIEPPAQRPSICWRPDVAAQAWKHASSPHLVSRCSSTRSTPQTCGRMWHVAYVS